MDISLNWIKDFVDLPSKLSAQELGELLTRHTAEVEGVKDLKKSYENMVLGKVTSLKKHPDADKLKLAKVDIGQSKDVQIVCGGQNLEEGMLVAVALPGSKVRWHGEGELVELKETKIRGEKSFGMICAGEEIGLETDNPKGASEVRIKDLSHLKAKAGTPLHKALHKDDVVLDIDNKSLTHRPDLWGHYGIAREFSAILEKPLKTLKEELKYKEGKRSARPKAQIKNDELCPRFSMAIVKGVKVGPSPQWMQSRLEAAGMNPINNIVDITNYVMLELGQPMHAYDRQVVGSDELIVRCAKKGEKLTALDEQEYTLHPEDPIVCNKKDEPLGIAGIKGGLKSGINADTNELILEAANWDKVMVRKASARIGLRTDASQRFEKGLDPSMTELAIQRALNLIQQLCPEAEVVSPIVTTGKWKAKTLKINLNAASVISKIGMDIPKTEMKRILKALDFKVSGSGEKLTVEVPSHRATGDVSLEEDLVEEIARIHGYDKIPAILPDLPIKLPHENEESFHKHTAREIMAHQLGFTELMNYSFYSKERLEKCGLSEEGHFKILNYLSEDQTHMRTSLTPNILAKISENSREFANMRVFEIGRNYKDTGNYMPTEQKWLVAAVVQKGEAFYEAKGAMQAFLAAFRTPKPQFKVAKTKLPYAHPKKSLGVLVRGQEIGQVFTVHPGVLKAFDIEQDVAIFALHFNALVEAGRPKVSFKEPAKFPGMEMDISVLVEERKTVEELKKAIQKSDKSNIIQSIRLFDTYSGKGIPDGQKSLSFRMELQHPERTLTDEEFTVAQEAIFLALEQIGATIRGKGN